MNENPEAFPGAGADNAGFVPADILLTETAQGFLNQTKPWVRFMSVMIFISSGFMVLAGFGLIMGGLVRGVTRTGQGPLGSFGAFGGAGGMLVTGCFYIVLAFLYIAPGVFLSQYASAIKLLQADRSAQTLEDAIKRQKSFWRYIGIMTIICLALAVVFIAFAVVFALLSIHR